MTPKITRQTKILIKDKKVENTSRNSAKFAVATDPIPTVSLRIHSSNIILFDIN